MDKQLRLLERMAIMGDEVAEEQLTTLRSRISSFGELERLVQDFLNFKKSSKEIIFSILQNLIHSHPLIFGFAYEIQYYEGEIADIRFEAILTVMGHDMGSCYIGPNFGCNENDVEYYIKNVGHLPEYKTMLEDLQKLRSLLQQLDGFHLISSIFGEHWAITAEGLLTDAEDIISAYHLKTTDSYKKDMLEAQLKINKRLETEQHKIEKLLEALDTTDRDLLRRHKDRI